MSSGRLRVVDRGELFRKELDAERAAGASVGLVPTMGALHEGHLSLIRRSVAECDITAVTIFVNPLQFGPGEDLDAYPRNLEGDLAVADSAGAAIVFAPTFEEMYPDLVQATVDAGPLGSILEGESRPGHFNGVATIVAKLFNLAGPCRAYFGEKDYQQLLVVRRLVSDLSFPVDVVSCPTVREEDGLAYSSRNVRLSPEQRRAAPVLHRALITGADEIRSGERRATRVRAAMTAAVLDEWSAALDYAEVADPDTLLPRVRVRGETRLLVAVRFGSVRLIDNMGVTPR